MMPLPRNFMVPLPRNFMTHKVYDAVAVKLDDTVNPLVKLYETYQHKLTTKQTSQITCLKQATEIIGNK